MTAPPTVRPEVKTTAAGSAVPKQAAWLTALTARTAPVGTPQEERHRAPGLVTLGEGLTALPGGLRHLRACSEASGRCADGEDGPQVGLEAF